MAWWMARKERQADAWIQPLLQVAIYIPVAQIPQKERQ
jgi:hypothetical protein